MFRNFCFFKLSKVFSPKTRAYEPNLTPVLRARGCLKVHWYPSRHTTFSTIFIEFSRFSAVMSVTTVGLGHGSAARPTPRPRSSPYEIIILFYDYRQRSWRRNEMYLPLL